MVRKVLILYYSQFGNTAKLASAIHHQTGADILRLQLPKDYFPEDMEKLTKFLRQIINQESYHQLRLSYLIFRTTILLWSVVLFGMVRYHPQS